MKILVTGASGYIGSALVPHLLSANHSVRVITRNAKRLDEHSWRRSVDVIEGDLSSTATCAQAVDTIDIVLHLAGLAHANAPTTEHEKENFTNTKLLADQAQQHGVRTFVFLSSCKANYPHHSSYGYYKRASENYLLQLQGSMNVTCLRPGIVYGAGMRNNLRSLLKILGKPWLPVFISASNTIGMISLTDCCQSIVAAMTQPALRGRCWELTDGVPYTLGALVNAIRENYGLPQPRWLCPPALVKLLCLLFEPIARAAGSSLGLRTYKAIYDENYAVDQAFAKASNTAPTADFYSSLRDNRHRHSN